MSSQSNFRVRIVVAGIGGAGVNAIHRMIDAGLSGVEFVAINTDSQVLKNSRAHHVLPIGVESTRGLGTGGNFQKGFDAAEETSDKIAEVLQGADLVFVTAGMGGGTGTGAAPVVAKISRELGLLTIAVVSTPFLFEGTRRRATADWGVKQLNEVLDTVLVVENQALLLKCDPTMELRQAFYLADDTLMKGVAGISDLITLPGQINLDFADIYKVLAGDGLAIWGVGTAQGEGACMAAAEKALSSPFMDDRKIDGCKTLLINVTGGEDLNFFEATEAAKYLSKRADKEAEIFFGTATCPFYGNNVKVTVIAKGATKVKRPHFLLPQIKSLDEVMHEGKKRAEHIQDLSDLGIPTALRRRLRESVG